MSLPFRILWVDDEAVIGGSSSGTNWPDVIRQLADPKLAKRVNLGQSCRITSNFRDKSASFCEIFFAGKFTDAVRVISEQLGETGVDCAILDVRLAKTSSVETDSGIAEYLKQKGCSPEVYNSRPGIIGTDIQRDMWLVFWLYREIVSRYSTVPVLFYTNYGQFAREVGLEPFMNPVGSLSPAIYDRSDNPQLTDRVMMLIKQRRNVFFHSVSPNTLNNLSQAVCSSQTCSELLRVMTDQRIFSTNQAATLADLFPEIAMRAQQRVKVELYNDKNILAKTLENALPRHNHCALYLRYCRPSQFNWSGMPDFGIKTLADYGCEGLVEVDARRSPFELLTHSSIDQSNAAKIAWQRSSELVRKQLEKLGSLTTPSSKEALEAVIEKAILLGFPVPTIPDDINSLINAVRWSPKDLACCCAKHKVVQVIEPIAVRFYGCSASIKQGLGRIAEDMVTNRKPKRACFAAVENGDSRPIWLTLWGEFDVGNSPGIPLPEGNKLREAKNQLEGFFHRYQFACHDLQWTWFELSRDHWESCNSPTKEIEGKLLSFLDPNITVVGHLFIAEDYPLER